MFLVIFYLWRSEISIFQYQPHSPRNKQTSYLCLRNKETCTVFDFVVFSNSFYMTKQISKELISRMKRVAWDRKRGMPANHKLPSLLNTDHFIVSRIRAWVGFTTRGAGGTTLCCLTSTSEVRAEETLYMRG